MQATYRPVASAAASGSSALAAFIDIRDSGEDQDLDRGQGDKERQRKFLLQLQRTKWLAQHGKLASDKSAGSSTNTVRINELMHESIVHYHYISLVMFHNNTEYRKNHKW